MKIIKITKTVILSRYERIKVVYKQILSLFLKNQSSLTEFMVIKTK